MKLALFDLDNTLLAGDSDYEWGQFMVEKGLVDADVYEAQNQKFFEDYKAGCLDIHEYAQFSLGRMGQFPMPQLEALRAEFVEQKIQPMVAAGSTALLNKHREQGHTLLIITATNSFITQPIAELLGVPNLIGTDGEIVEGRFTGKIQGTPCFQDGKIDKLLQWLEQHGNAEESWFYSDSINDAPLLEWADHAHAVDACPKLAALASERGWDTLSLR